jgi:hypothetical protein
MKTHRGPLWGLALTALMGLTASPARAELISITVGITGGPALTTDAWATVTATSYDVIGPAGITALNSFLATNGSAYQFVSLSGSSDWSGDAQRGQLVLGSEVRTGLTSGTNTGLTITETEAGFLGPSSTTRAGILRSSASATNQPAGDRTEARSQFDSLIVPFNPLYPVPGSALFPVGPPIPTLYPLTNVLVLGLPKGTTANPIDVTFGVTATISVVPEPSSLVLLVTALPLVAYAWRRRRPARSRAAWCR